MGANDGFTPDENIPPKDKISIPLGYQENADGTIEEINKDWRYRHPIPEQPLTHHQQAVKDFMVVLVGKTNWQHKIIAEEASKLADAFINQINKK